MTDRLPCANEECANTILPITAGKTAGYCMPCFRKKSSGQLAFRGLTPKRANNRVTCANRECANTMQPAMARKTGGYCLVCVNAGKVHETRSAGSGVEVKDLVGETTRSLCTNEECANTILPITAEKTRGFCMPCFLEIGADAAAATRPTDSSEDRTAGSRPGSPLGAEDNWVRSARSLLFDPSLFSRDNGVSTGGPCLIQYVPAQEFHPIGELSEDTPSVKVVYFPVRTDDSLDVEWLESFVPDMAGLVDGLKQAFAEYCSPEWCGLDAIPEIEEELEGSDLARFQEDGHVLFIQLAQLIFNRKTRSLVIDACCEIDGNLVEHAVSIRFKDNEWRFGYAGDWLRESGAGSDEDEGQRK